MQYDLGLIDNHSFHLDYGDLKDTLSETVAGYTFPNGSGKERFLYKDGVFYSITEAYEAGLIDEDDLHELGIRRGVILPGDEDVTRLLAGDLNKDFKVDSADAALILRYDMYGYWD